MNVPAGFYPNLDHVTEHYRKQYHDEQERREKKAARLREEREQAESAREPSA